VRSAGLVGHAAIGAARFADQKKITRNEIVRPHASFALGRTGGVIGCVLDEMHLRPVGNDLGDRDWMRHFERDAEAIAGIFVGARQRRDQRHEQGGDRARPPKTPPHGADRFRHRS
jgi:hypothetical protein